MASPFLWEPGTSNNGLYASALTLMTTELNGLAANASVLSSVNGSTGLFTNSNTGQVMVGELFFIPGNVGSMTTPGAGANLAIYFLSTSDGTTFETAATLTRPPDALIPLPPASFTATAGTLSFKATNLIMITALKFYVMVTYNTPNANAMGAGATTSNKLVFAPTAWQY